MDNSFQAFKKQAKEKLDRVCTHEGVSTASFILIHSVVAGN
jgi:hypothetical protein